MMIIIMFDKYAIQCSAMLGKNSSGVGGGGNFLYMA